MKTNGIKISIIHIAFLIFQFFNFSIFQFSLFSQTGLDSSLAANLQQTLDNTFANYNLKGVAAGMSLPNGDIWLGASGTSNGTDSIKTDMLFAIGSNTKTFTSSIIMQLIEEGKLKLSDSIYHWIDNYNFVDSTISIYHLLTHTSGIFDYADHPAVDDSFLLQPERFWYTEEVLSNFLDTPYFDKGNGYHYSNSGYLILGLIITSITGNTLSDELHNRILFPLELTHTFLDQEDSLQGTLAHMWYDVFENNVPIDLTAMGISQVALFSAAWTAGAIFSTAEDMLKWSKELFYHQTVVSDSSLLEMIDFIPAYDYGLGVREYSISGRSMWGHGGDAVHISLAAYSPQDTVSIIILCNDNEMTSSQSEKFAEALMNSYLGISTVSELYYANKTATAFPNPFSSDITIKYELAETSTIEFCFYNALGQEVDRMTIAEQSPGTYFQKWNTISKGLYLCKVSYNNRTEYFNLVKQ